jgi:hypothetical protein
MRRLALIATAAALPLAACSSPLASTPISVPSSTSAAAGTSSGSAPATSSLSSSGPGSKAVVPTSPRGDAPHLDQVDRANPAAVGAAFVKIAWTVDTRIDQGPGAAGLRATPLATTKLAASLQSVTTAGADTSEWAAWTAHQAYTVVQLGPANDTKPDDTPTTAYRAWWVSVAPVGSGWKGAEHSFVAYVTLTQTAGIWAVSDLRVSQ